MRPPFFAPGPPGSLKSNIVTDLIKTQQQRGDNQNSNRPSSGYGSAGGNPSTGGNAGAAGPSGASATSGAGGGVGGGAAAGGVPNATAPLAGYSAQGGPSENVPSSLIGGPVEGADHEANPYRSVFPAGTNGADTESY